MAKKKESKMKCLICGNKLNSDNKKCPCCNVDTHISLNKSLFSWNFEDKQRVKELRLQYNEFEKEYIKAECEQENRATIEKDFVECHTKENTDKHKPSKKKILIGGIIAVVLINGIITNMSNEVDYGSVMSGEKTAISMHDENLESTGEDIDSEWDDIRVELNDWEIPVKTYGRFIENCKGFTLDFLISDVADGDPYGEWIIYLRNENGVWKEIATFEHTKDYNDSISSWDVQAETVFEPFDAIALARKSNEPSNHSFWYNTMNFVFEE